MERCCYESLNQFWEENFLDFNYFLINKFFRKLVLRCNKSIRKNYRKKGKPTLLDITSIEDNKKGEILKDIFELYIDPFKISNAKSKLSDIDLFKYSIHKEENIIKYLIKRIENLNLANEEK